MLAKSVREVGMVWIVKGKVSGIQEYIDEESQRSTNGLISKRKRQKNYIVKVEYAEEHQECKEMCTES